jgi:hypothetical protein
VLAAVYLQTNRLPEAEREAQQTYRDQLEVWGKTNPITLIGQGLLARVYLAQRRRGEADKLLRGLREQAPRLQERPFPIAIWTIGTVGDALLGQGVVVEAESFLRLYLDLAGKKLPDGWRRSARVSALGACLVGQKKYAEAEPLLLKGYEGLRQHEESIPVSLRRTRLTEALERLVQFYDEWDKPDKAAKWRKELEEAKAH